MIDKSYEDIMNSVHEDIIDKAKKIELVIFDVDGILTDGGIYMTKDGHESKRFFAQDGHGIVLLKSIGIEIGIISGRNSKCVDIRGKELGIRKILQNSRNKLEDFQASFLSQFEYENTCFVGDDVVDAKLLSRVGLSITVPNANFKLAEQSIDWVTPRTGGSGAVRDVCDLIYHSKK